MCEPAGPAWAWRSRLPHFIYCHSRVYLCPTDTPRTWTGTTVGALVPLDDILEGLGKRSLGAGLVGGGPAPPSPPSPHPRYPIAQEDLKLMLPWGSLC